MSKESAALNEAAAQSESAAPDISAPVVTLQVHPWRSALYEELHNRPSPIIEGVCQITHFTVMLGDASQALYEHIVDLCKRLVCQHQRQIHRACT